MMTQFNAGSAAGGSIGVECISSAVATIQVFASGFALPVVLGEVSCFSRFQFAFEAYCAVGDRIAVYSAVLFGRPGALFACGAKSGIKNAQGRAGIYIYIYTYISTSLYTYIYMYNIIHLQYARRSHHSNKFGLQFCA